MITTEKLKNEFYKSCQEHIIEIDHNTKSGFEQEFSFHAICHPEMTDGGIPKVPDEVENFIKSKTGKYDIEFLDSQIHAHIQINIDELYHSENVKQ